MIPPRLAGLALVLLTQVTPTSAQDRLPPQSETSPTAIPPLSSDHTALRQWSSEAHSDDDFAAGDSERNQAKAVAEIEQLIATQSEVTLFALLPTLVSGSPPLERSNAQTLGGYLILGHLGITSRNDRELLLGTLVDSVRHPQKSAACFHPRHALRFKTRTKTIEFLISFSCGKMRLSGLETTEAFIWEAGEKVFNYLLDQNQISRDREP